MQGVEDKFTHYVENESWSALANLAIQFQVDLGKEERDTKKLRKRIALTKHLLHVYLKECDKGNGFLHTPFFVSLVKLTDSLEVEFGRHDIQRRDFIVFLRLIVHKLKKHKMFAHKPHMHKNEFRKMKDALENQKEPGMLAVNGKMIENGHSSL